MQPTQTDATHPHFNPDDYAQIDLKTDWLLHANEPDSLDACEIPVDSHEERTLASAIRFGNQRPERNLWLTVIDDLDLSFSQRNRFKECGDNPWIEVDPSTDNIRLRTNACKSRFCPHCRKHRQHRWRRTINAAIDHLPRDKWKLITLTIKHSDEDLKSQLKFLRSSFRKLRQTKIWSNNIQ